MASLGEQAVGSIVKLNVGGTPREFIVVQQGLPSSAYDSSCDGTWLLMKDCYEKRVWNSASAVDYASASVYSYLNDTFFNKLDDDIAAVVKQVKLPYAKSAGLGHSVVSGASGLPARVFLLSYTEVGYSGSNGAPVEGAALDYFNGAANSARIAYFNGTAVIHWLRSPYISSSQSGVYAWAILTTGASSNLSVTSTSYYIRPAMVLPSEIGVDDGGFVVAKKQEVGFVNIGGLLKPLTGEGIMNKGGTLYPITKSSKVNISSVLKALLIGTEIKTSRLPDGYTEVEYIQSSGAQHIDTGYKPNNKTRIIMDCDIISSDRYPTAFGAWNSSSGNDSSFIYVFTSATSGFYYYGSGYVSVSAGNLYGRHTIDANANKLYLDGANIASASAQTFNCSYNMYLSAFNDVGKVNNNTSMKIYSCQIYDNGTIIRDFVPCKNSSGAAGLYDLVNNKFYGNNGTGSFTAGAEV